jgi:phosphatidylglycerophosphatase C
MSGTSTYSAAGSTVVVFDFDGTLVSRDSFVDFCFAYCRAHPARWLLIVPLLPVALLLLLTRSQGAAGSVLLWAMTVGCSTRSFVLALQCYASRTLTRYAFEDIFAELTRHLGEGSRVVIATGSVPTLVRGLLAAKGLAPLPVAGTRLRRAWGGLISETHCTGAAKVGELRRRFGIHDWTGVYTNSFADHSLLSQAHDITLVHPNRRTLRLTQRLTSKKATLRVLRPS